MSDWRGGVLSDFAIIAPKVAPLPENAPFIAMADVQEWGRWAQPSGPRGGRNGCRAHGGDVIVARITPCLENGKIAQVPRDLGDVGGSTEFIAVRARPEFVRSDFLCLLLQEHAVHSQAVNLMAGTSGRQRVSAKDLGSVSVVMPPIEEQIRILTIMSSVDSTIEALAREASRLQVLLTHTRESVVERHTADYGSLPLGQVLREIKRPIQVADGAFYDQIGVRSFGRGIFTKIAVSGSSLGTKKVFWVEPGDLVINIVFGWEGAVAVGPPPIENHCGSHRFPTFKRTDEGPIEYVRQFLLSRSGVEILGLASPGGAGRNRTLNRSRLLSFAMPAAPVEVQHAAASALVAIEAQHAAVTKEARSMRVTRSSMLTALLSREISIDAAVDRFVKAA